jgi:hypothetical protein
MVWLCYVLCSSYVQAALSLPTRGGRSSLLRCYSVLAARSSSSRRLHATGECSSGVSGVGVRSGGVGGSEVVSSLHGPSRATSDGWSPRKLSHAPLRVKGDAHFEEAHCARGQQFTRLLLPRALGVRRLDGRPPVEGQPASRRTGVCVKNPTASKSTGARSTTDSNCRQSEAHVF